MENPAEQFDVIVLGAGGAGMMCALTAGGFGKRVVILDHAKQPGGKILISGGGRCNFTNLGAGPANYVSQNPHFMQSALSRFKPAHFVAMVERHAIPYHEKKLGQLFCDNRAKDIVDLLTQECANVGVEFRLETKIDRVVKIETGYEVRTPTGAFTAPAVVVATGGFSLPKLGATGIGYDIAKRYGHTIIETAPALDGFTWQDSDLPQFKDLAGISLDVIMRAGGKAFRENILFTHGGLSGPASLQASLHWRKGEPVQIRVAPELDLRQWLIDKKREGNRVFLPSTLNQILPSRVVERWLALHPVSDLPLPQIGDHALGVFAHGLTNWEIFPAGTVGYSKAEVTRGGVSTDEVSSRTMESKKSPGLYFIGEVLDVTGWLGGYNYQWAWASGSAAGEAIAGVI